jgi:hypothetical protein
LEAIVPAKRKKKKVDPRAIHASTRMKKKPKYTVEEIYGFQNRALQLYASDESHAKELGQALLKVKTVMKHGDFKKWWQHNNLSQNRVSYCMRVALGKVKPKFRRPVSQEKVVEIGVRASFNKFVNFCTNPSSMQTVEQFHGELKKLCHGIVVGVSQIRHWRLVDSDESRTAVKHFDQALWEMLDNVFVQVSFKDLEQITLRSGGSPGSMSEYRKAQREAEAAKKPVQAEPATDAASSAKAGA